MAKEEDSQQGKSMHLPSSVPLVQ